VKTNWSRDGLRRSFIKNYTQKSEKMRTEITAHNDLKLSGNLRDFWREVLQELFDIFQFAFYCLNHLHGSALISSQLTFRFGQLGNDFSRKYPFKIFRYRRK
jgi:hypothetical protein